MRYSTDGGIQYKYDVENGKVYAVSTHDNSTVKSLGHRFEAIYGSGVSRDRWIARANGGSSRRF